MCIRDSGLADGYLKLVETYLSQEPALYHVPLREAYYRHDAGPVSYTHLVRLNVRKSVCVKHVVVLSSPNVNCFLLTQNLSLIHI